MKLQLDTEARQLTVDGRAIPLYSREAFEALSLQWLRLAWSQKYPYTFSWLGRPVIQLPEDMIRAQEVLFRLQPDVIVETGVAHGGSLVYYASLCQLFGRGRVIGVDIEIRAHNRSAIEAHPQSARIALIEGSSTDAGVVRDVASRIKPGEKVLVFLDSNHTKAHVAAELAAYAPLVTPGSYIVATDGFMKDLHDVPRGEPAWAWDNPTAAAAEFAAAHPEFVLEQPAWPFNESELRENLTYWPGAWLRRKS
jgi:cephalosporin hydroxylase